MRVLSPFFAASVALLAAGIDGAEVPADPFPNSERTFQHIEAFMPGEGSSSPRQKGERWKFSVGVAVFAATVATVFFFLQCFRALQSNKNPSSLGTNRRNLAEGGPDPCGVGLGQHKLSCEVVVAERLDAREVVHACPLACNGNV